MRLLFSGWPWWACRSWCIQWWAAPSSSCLQAPTLRQGQVPAGQLQVPCVRSALECTGPFSFWFAAVACLHLVVNRQCQQRALLFWHVSARMPTHVCCCAAGAVDTKQFESDADRMFDWDDVLLVDMRSLTPVQCPISLDSPPVCPQITPCGHVFSFGSIMRHLMTHGGEQLRRSAPCPLCYQPLVARELRLVQVRNTQLQRAVNRLCKTTA